MASTLATYYISLQCICKPCCNVFLSSLRVAVGNLRVSWGVAVWCFRVTNGVAVGSQAARMTLTEQ